MRAGDVVASKYELVSRVGQGGMGAVWRVAHRSTGREFAIKFLHAAVATSEDSRQRFLQEAKASARINHPNIIDIFDVGETEDGTLYLVMELLDGISLGEALRSEPPFNARELLMLLAEACTALIAAHAAGVIHRDIKPPNIFLHRDRGTGFVTAKVLDFGVSKVLAGDDGVSTHTGSLLGSPRYMSPEQAHSAAAADGRSDIWSIGVVLFEALTGRFPHDGDSSNSLVVAIATRPPKLIESVSPQLPAALRLLINDCLKPQKERVSSAESLLDRLLALLATEDLSDIPLARPTVAKGKSRVRPESFILRTSPGSIPGLATSMARGRSAILRSGEMAGIDAQLQQNHGIDKAQAQESEAAIRRSAGEFSFGNTSTAETPRLAGRGAQLRADMSSEDATLVNVVADPTTDTFRRGEIEPPRTELLPVQLPREARRNASWGTLPSPGQVPSGEDATRSSAPPPIAAGAKATLPMGDPAAMAAAADARGLLLASGQAHPTPGQPPNGPGGTWMMMESSVAPSGAGSLAASRASALVQTEAFAQQPVDPTIESISSINVARGASLAHQEAAAQLVTPFTSGDAKRTQALWALLAGVAVLTVVVSTALIVSYSRSTSPGDPVQAAQPTAAATSGASQPVTPQLSPQTPSEMKHPASATPDATSSSPVTSVSSLPPAQRVTKPPIVGGGRRIGKPGDPVKDLGSGLN